MAKGKTRMPSSKSAAKPMMGAMKSKTMKPAKGKSMKGSKGC